VVLSKENRNIAVKGNPLSTAVPGEYPVNIKVTANGSKEKSQFKIILTGTHESKVGTISSMVFPGVSPRVLALTRSMLNIPPILSFNETTIING